MESRIAELAKTAEEGMFAVANSPNPPREAQRRALLLAFDASGVGVNLNDYTRDDFSRDGCSVVLRIRGGKFEMAVYAPTYVPHGGRGLVESYTPRALDEIGAAMDAFVKGHGVRPGTTQESTSGS